MAARKPVPVPVLRDALARAHAVLQALAAQVAARPEVEAVHEFRVCARRVRAALSLFKPALQRPARRIAKRLRALARKMAEMRDIDVTLERLAQWGAVEPVARALSRRRLALEPRVRRAVQSNSARATLAALQAPLKLKDKPPAGALLRRIEARFGRARKRALRKPSHQNLHKLRLRGKELRYVLELLGAREPVQKALRALQECLGEYFDAHLVIAAVKIRAPAHTVLRLPARKAGSRIASLPGLLARVDKALAKLENE